MQPESPLDTSIDPAQIHDAATQNRHEQLVEHSIRPQTLDAYVGQTAVCEQMQIFISAAKSRHESLDHTLIFGPPGLGKTTLANIIATEMGVNIKQTSGPVLEKAGDIAATLSNLEPHDVLFIDEIHRLNPALEELLYPAMEDFKLDIMLGEGPAARSIQLDLPPFTLVGATTRAGLLTSPLRDRFGIVQRLEFYQAHELAQIITRNARILNTSLTAHGADEIAKRSRGTPRIANRLLRRVRDYAQVKGDGTITSERAEQALDLLHVDRFGFDNLDRKFLHTLMVKFNGGPAGVETLAAAMSEDRGTIEDILEPYLLQEGFIQRTPRGRVATAKAFQYLGLKPPAHRSSQPQLDLSQVNDE